MARVYGGDAGGLEELERSLERADRSGSVYHHHSALNNFANVLYGMGRLEEGSARIHEARALCERYGFPSALRWNDAELVYDAHFRGDLEGVLSAADAFLAHDSSMLGYQLRPVLATRALTLLARGRTGEGVNDAEHALADLREGGADAQVAPIVLTAAALSFRAAGRDQEADALLTERLTFASDQMNFHLPLHLVELGRSEDVLSQWDVDVPGRPWRAAGRAAAAGDLVGASQIYGSIGARFAEAWAALLAAERGDTSRLDAAFAYFEEQQATPYVERCRAFMQASA
jgi:tetratricopeptide (TPR) repeat protein